MHILCLLINKLLNNALVHLELMQPLLLIKKQYL